MKGMLRWTVVPIVLFLAVQQAFALSLELRQPDINFPKGYDHRRAEQILNILRDPKLNFLNGIISYWPPDWPTTVVYDSDTESLNNVLAALAKVPGISVALSFTRSATGSWRDAAPGSWQVRYAQTAPNRLSILVNLKSEKIDVARLHLPEWKAGH